MHEDDEDDDDRTMIHKAVVPLAAPAQAAGQSPCLIVVSGRTSVGKMFKLKGEMSIGRTPRADIYLDDDGVSRKHADVVVTPDGTVEVRDLGSTNGTYHDGQRIRTHVLRDGDKIQIGSTTILKFSYQDAIDEALQKNLYESATRDGLTRIYNKKYFTDALKKEFAYAFRQHVPLSLVLFDVDHFKKINDTHGHPAGDYVLQTLAAKVGECIRTEDTCARYGGEEFALLLREISEEKALVCAERVRRVIEATEFVFQKARIPVTISLGVGTYLGDSHPTPEALIETADRYLYRAKQGGRNRVEAQIISGA